VPLPPLRLSPSATPAEQRQWRETNRVTTSFTPVRNEADLAEEVVGSRRQALH
jgi:hypothetical protein